MKKTLIILFAGLLFCSLPLAAQNTEVVISGFKAFSFFNNGLTADSIFYQAETPAPGSVLYTEDSLDVYSGNGFFELNYLPADSPAFVAIWVDSNGDGLFDKDEQIYAGAAKEGSLADDLPLPAPEGARKSLLAISTDETQLSDPRTIIGNERLSSVQFIIRGAPPKLTMTSKKDTRDTLEVYCMTIPMEMISGPGFPCLTIAGWQLNYSPGLAAQVDSNVTVLPAGVLFGIGDTVQPGDYIEFELDFSAYPVTDGDLIELVCYYEYCGDPLSADSISFSFYKDCLIDGSRYRDNYFSSFSIYPNPVSEEVLITYDLERSGPVCLRLLDVNGRQLEEIRTPHAAAGRHQLPYRPKRRSQGLYWLSLQSRDAVVTKKIMILSP